MAAVFKDKTNKVNFLSNFRQKLTLNAPILHSVLLKREKSLLSVPTDGKKPVFEPKKSEKPLISAIKKDLRSEIFEGAVCCKNVYKSTHHKTPSKI